VFQQAHDRPPVPIVVIAASPTSRCVARREGRRRRFSGEAVHDQELIDAVNLALSLDTARRTNDSTRRRLQQLFEQLTRREREVLAHVVSGALNKQIASQLGLSLITVKQHRASVMRKMNASSLADLVRKSEAIGVHAPAAG
jgi:FixJ family two-component response regulator